VIRRAVGALVFVGVAVVLAKVGQYAAVGWLAPSIGFDAASLVGAAPVVIGAALLRRSR